MKLNDYAYWNAKSYGSAFRIKKRYILIGLIFLCVVTPFTNWLIPFLKGMIKSDFVFRF